MAAIGGAPAMTVEQDALGAYESLAPFYDAFTDGYAHEDWLGQIERVLLELGLRGRRVLDVACGTGKSSLPLLRRGYELTACDVSPGMVEVARARLDLPEERVFVADMRRLPGLSGYDAVTCLDDAVNYLLHEEELTDAFAGMAEALRPGGLLVFDVNTLATYAQAFTAESVREGGGARFTWRGEAIEPVEAGELFSATLEIETADGTVRSVHAQRHYPRHVIARSLHDAGLELVRELGQATGARLSPGPDERRHSKIVYVARRRETP
jgi:SAM-dependent methyltransferase